MYIDPLLPCLTHGPKLHRGWPKYSYGRAVEYRLLSELLTRPHDHDAHVCAYSVPRVRRRLLTHPPAYERPEIPEGIPMAVLFFDVDCAAAHRALGGSGAVHADDAWWHATRALIARLFEAHPDGFAYRTRGGARIVYRPAVPLIIADAAGEIAWKRLYLARLAYLARRFGIVADPSISDWPRVHRLPHVTRDEVFKHVETLGDPYRVGAFELPDDEARERADLEHARSLVGAIPAWGPALRILARNALPAARRTRPARAVEHREFDAGGWEQLAADLGRALRTHHGRHLVHLALAGACYARGVPLDRGPDLAAAICEASGETDDRPQVWQTTAEKVRAGAAHTGFEHLARHWPDLAALVDAALPAGGGARTSRDELDARGITPERSAAEAAEVVRAALVDARAGLSVVRVTEGAGKTRAAAEVVRARTLAVGDSARVESAAKTVFVAATHAVAAEVATALRGTRAEYRRSVLAVPGPHQGHACAYHVPLARLVGAGHDVRTWCEGRGMGRNGKDSPCPAFDGCPARAGSLVRLDGLDPEADSTPSPATVITVHTLLGAALGWAGPDAMLVIDEDPSPVTAVAITRADLDSAVSAEDLYASTERWRFVFARVLAAGMERGDLPTGEGQLLEVVTRGVAALTGDTAWEAAVAAHYELSAPGEAPGEAPGDAPSNPNAPVDPSALLQAFAVRAVWFLDRRDPKAPRWRRRGAWAPRPSPRERARVFSGSHTPRMERASRILAELAHLVAGVVRATPPGAVGHAERAALAVEVSHEDATRRVLRGVLASAAVSAALHRYGPTVLLDATADLVQLAAVAGAEVPVVDVRVADGAPVTRVLLYWSGASRKNTYAEGGLGLSVRWGEGLARYLRAALGRVLDAGARRIALFTWKVLAEHLEAVARGVVADGAAEDLLAWVRAQGGELVVGHYGAARGRNDWATCDGLVSVGDPRPNVGSSRAVAGVLGLAEEHGAIYRRAIAAEVSQVSGRLRAPWRATPAIHVHVGTVAPDAWDQRAEVMELPRGVAEGVDPTSVVNAVRVHGSQRMGGRQTGVSERTARRVIQAKRVNEDAVTGVQSCDTERAKNAAPAGSHTPGQVPPTKYILLAACGRVCDTSESQGNHPAAPLAEPATMAPDPGFGAQRALIARAGGAARVATLVGVGRATAYHWGSGARAMPAAAVDALRVALARPAPAKAQPEAATAARAAIPSAEPTAPRPRFEAPHVATPWETFDA